jgi:cytochrome P450
MSPSRLEEWRSEIQPLNFAMPLKGTVDLVSEVARPWALECAMRITRPSSDAKRMAGLAQAVFAAAAEPFDTELQNRSHAATAELAQCFNGNLRALETQAFVALSQTLPCFLVNAWSTLIQHPILSEEIRKCDGLIPAAIEELLRYSGPSHMQLRVATDAVVLNGRPIPKGTRVALMLSVANRDPERFTDPHRVDIHRRGARHVAFGAGAHACLGAALIRMTASLAIRDFVQRAIGAQIVESVRCPRDWAIQSPLVLRLAVNRT